MAGATLALSLMVLVGKGVGLVRELVVARAFGAGPEMDAFLVGYTIPEALSFLALAVALNLFLPLYVTERERDPGSAARLASAFFARSGLILLVVSAAISVSARPLLGILAPDLPPALESTALLSLRVLSFVILLRGMEGVFRGLANSHRSFLLPALTAVAASIAVILAVLLWARQTGVEALIWGIVAGAAMPPLILIVRAMVGTPEVFRSFFAGHPALGEYGRRLPWFLAIESAGLLLPLIDRVIATRYLGPGNISALSYARVLFEVPFNLVGLALATTLYPEFVSMLARGERGEFQRLFRRGIRALIGIVLPIAVLFVVLREPLVRALFERGAFDAEATRLTAGALGAYALGLPFLTAASLAFQASYASGALGRLLWTRLLALGVKIGLSLILVRHLGQVGLALATTMFFVVLFLTLVRPLAGTWRGLVPRPGVLMVALVLAGMSGWGVTRLLLIPSAEHGVAALAIQVLAWGVAGMVYLGICRWRRVEDVLWVEARLREIWTRRSGP